MRARDRWREILSRFQDCGLTVGEFCRIEGVSTASFYQWRRKLGGANNAAGSSATLDDAPLFVPVHVTPPESIAHDLPTPQPCCMELELNSGHVLRIPDHASQQAIVNVLAALGVS